MALHRYVAFLRGVSPMNLKMPQLKRCLEDAGFEHVSTLLASGNVVFSAPRAPNASLQKKLQKAMEKGLHRPFLAFVRPIADIRELIEQDPYEALKVAPGAKRVVTFLHQPHRAKLELPIRQGKASILAVKGLEVLSAYVSNPKDGPLFMTLLEKTFGEDITTRTWGTLEKVAADKAYSAS